jgi:hypothetical protein
MGLQLTVCSLRFAVQRFGLAISIVEQRRTILGCTPETLHLPEIAGTANGQLQTANHKLFNLYAREFDAKVRVTRKEVL